MCPADHERQVQGVMPVSDVGSRTRLGVRRLGEALLKRPPSPDEEGLAPRNKWEGLTANGNGLQKLSWEAWLVWLRG